MAPLPLLTAPRIRGRVAKRFSPFIIRGLSHTPESRGAAAMNIDPIVSRLGALELGDASLEAAALAGPVQTQKFGCTMIDDAALEDRKTAGPTTGISCTPTLSATVCHLIDDGVLEETVPVIAGPTSGGCFMSHPPQCRKSHLGDAALEAAARHLAGPTNGCGFTHPPMCHRVDDSALEASALVQPQTQHCAPPRTNIVMSCLTDAGPDQPKH
jgi:hypothetical protein